MFTKEQINEALKIYKSDKRIVDVSRQMHLSYQQARQLLVTGGAQVKLRRSIDEQQLLRDFEANMSSHEIRSKYKIGSSRYSAILWKNGILDIRDMRRIIDKRGKNEKKERNDQIVALYREELTMEQIAYRFGISRERVRGILNQRGEKIRPRGSYAYYAKRLHERSNPL